MCATKKIGETLARYEEAVTEARKKLRETFRYIQEICPHSTVSCYRPNAKLLEQLLEHTSLQRSTRPFSHVVFRICPSCGKEEQVVYSGLLPGELKEDLEKRIFPNSIYRHYNTISEPEFFRLRNIFAYLSANEY